MAEYLHILRALSKTSYTARVCGVYDGDGVCDGENERETNEMN